MKETVFCIVGSSLALVNISLTGCKQRESAQHEVVVYTSLDKVFSQPILEAFEKETGIKVLDVYDSEATKTTGLVNRLIAEKDNPRADVLWNSETGRTIVLKRKGVLARYVSPSAAYKLFLIDAFSHNYRFSIIILPTSFPEISPSRSA